MKCPYCGTTCADDALFCPSCRQPMTESDASERFRGERRERTPWQKAGIAALWIVFAAVLIGGIFRVTTWIRGYQLNRLYTRGEYTPTLSTLKLDDLRVGHALTFYGHDGDQIFLPEMDRSLTVSGGVARMEIDDSEWFGLNVTDVDYADITLSPMLITEKGEKTELPQLNFQIQVPESPLNVSSPASPRVTVVTSVYPLELHVVPGSTVFVNGEDVTDSIDRSGLLSTNLSIQPIGDNLVTLIVRTPRHKENRTELVIFRQHFDIEMELDPSVKDRSSNNTMAVTGTAEPGSVISVDTDYVPQSLLMDMETGKFSFIAKFSAFGDNIVRFRASQEGKSDAIISFTVYYMPNYPDYTARAWKMDYKGLKQLFEQWHGRIFKCTGTVIDVLRTEEGTYMIMDVGTDGEQQLLVLQNMSAVTNPTAGRRYTAWADVQGRYMYNAEFYPMLITRYLDLEGS